MKLALAAVALAAASVALGQDRPTEEELFGAPPAATAPGEPRDEAPPRDAPRAAEDLDSPRPDEAELFGDRSSPNAAPPPPAATARRDPEDPLHLGGHLYLRASTLWQERVAPSRWGLSSPNLLDLYVDVRPNDRVRGFALGRMTYDPTVGAAATALPLGAPSALEALTPSRPAANPRVVLDQLWVNFDVERRVFVTAGRQHVKWGVGKFWNPTDYLHPVRRDPLAVYDERAGTTMLRVHAPWEARGWNAYGVALLDDLAGEPEPTNRLGRVALGARAEVVLGAFELGADAIAQDGRRPRFGVDVSGGVWELDLYAEAALRTGTDAPRWRVAAPGAPLLERYESYRPEGFTPAYVAGGSWSRNYTDEDVITLGAEYAYDAAGYDDSTIYPFLLAGAPELTGDPAEPLRQRDPGAFRPFSLGKHYAGAFVLLPSPGRWNDTTFTLSVLGNLSDRSFVARLDHALLALTYLRIESYAAASFGREGGELRLGFDLPGDRIATGLPPSLRLTSPAPVLQLGLALRVSL
jgi:hypothetical protein